MTHPLHEKALVLAAEFKRVESELVDVLQKIDEGRVYRKLGFSSLFDYGVRALGLSESVTYALIAVARKSVEVPELKLAIESGELSVSKAKNLTSVLTIENAPELLEMAKGMTHRELEKEVARLNPKEAKPARTRYLSEELVELKMALPEQLMKKLQRIQDLESQRTQEARELVQALEAMADLYLEKKDPLLKKPSARKASRTRRSEKADWPFQASQSQDNFGGKDSAKSNRKLPASTKLQVQQRDETRCAYVDSTGQRCKNTRWLEIHHLQPVSHGGRHTLENLTTLCHAHHKLQHAL